MINLFGITIESPPVTDGTFLDQLLTVVAKKGDERRLLMDFLISNDHLSEVINIARDAASQCTDPLDQKPQAIEFYLSQAKQSGIYEQMVLRCISQDDTFRSAPFARQLLTGKSPKLPNFYPGDHKKAESLVVGSLLSAIDASQCRQYLIRKLVKSRVQDIAKDMFFAINSGANYDQAYRFLGIMYELGKLQTADPTNPNRLKRTILESIITGRPIKLIHIKCLRITYPHGNRLKLISHINPTTVPTKDFSSHQPPDEEKLFSRLAHIANILRSSGIDTSLEIVVSDQDLEDYFPGNQTHGLFPPEDLDIARSDIDVYTRNISQVDGVTHATTLRQFLLSAGLLEAFDQRRRSLIVQMNQSGGTDLVGNGYIGEKIKYRIQSNRKIFTTDPGEPFAQERVYGQVASMQALSVLSESHGFILIEEDRGNDNKYIGGYKNQALPTLFVRLRD